MVLDCGGVFIYVVRRFVSEKGYGGMAEWTKAPVLKTGDGRLSVGSNPTPSANFWGVRGNGCVSARK